MNGGGPARQDEGAGRAPPWRARRTPAAPQSYPPGDPATLISPAIKGATKLPAAPGHPHRPAQAGCADSKVIADNRPGPDRQNYAHKLPDLKLRAEDTLRRQPSAKTGLPPWTADATHATTKAATER